MHDCMACFIIVQDFVKTLIIRTLLGCPDQRGSTVHGRQEEGGGGAKGAVCPGPCTHCIHYEKLFGINLGKIFQQTDCLLITCYQMFWYIRSRGTDNNDYILYIYIYIYIYRYCIWHKYKNNNNYYSLKVSLFLY